MRPEGRITSELHVVRSGDGGDESIKDLLYYDFITTLMSSRLLLNPYDFVSVLVLNFFLLFARRHLESFLVVVVVVVTSPSSRPSQRSSHLPIQYICMYREREKERERERERREREKRERERRESARERQSDRATERQSDRARERESERARERESVRA